MYKGKKILAVILARGGSKSIPDKNIKIFAGKPLLVWTIEAAQKSRYIDRIILSTDSTRITNIGKSYGAEAPFLRPKKISTDNASSMDALGHAIRFLKGRGDNFDIVVLLQPTSPLRQHTDIDKAVETLFKKKAKTVVSVNEAFSSPLWANRLPANGSMEDFLNPLLINKARQKLPRYFQLNGAIFLGFIEHIMKKNTFYGKGSFAYIMPRDRSIDIDDMLDFTVAEALAVKYNSRGKAKTHA